MKGKMTEQKIKTQLKHLLGLLLFGKIKLIDIFTYAIIFFVDGEKRKSIFPLIVVFNLNQRILGLSGVIHFIIWCRIIGKCDRK